MLLQECVKRLISQMEDRRAGLRPGHLWSFRLWWLGAVQHIKQVVKNISISQNVFVVSNAYELHDSKPSK